MCRTAEIVCGKWTLLLIRDLAEGRSRFCELERSLAGISPRTLSLRLRALEEEGIVERQTYAEVPPRVEYALTEKGRALIPIIDGMRTYGEDAGSASAPNAVSSALDRSAASPPPRAGLSRPPCDRAPCNPAAPSRRARDERRSVRPMRSRQLETALTEFVSAPAAGLQAEVAAGAEVPFELEQQRPPRGRRGRCTATAR